MNNLAIWDQVSKTDPDMTEKVNFGAFKFTTIDSMYQIQQATKVFGPCGQGWGTRNERFTPIVADPADPHYTLLCYQAEFWYIFDGKEGKQEIAADIELFENTKNGWKRVSDPVKKVRTAGLSKGLSWLGFSADVFLGKFDDQRYVNELKQEKAQAARQQQAKPAQPTSAQRQEAVFQRPSQALLDAIIFTAKQINLTGHDFKDWLQKGYSTTYQRMTDEQARLVLNDLQELAKDEAAAGQAEAGAYEGVSA